MADLLEQLLRNSSSPQLLTVLYGYLETTEDKRNADYYSSLKSVLIHLKQHGELQEEIIQRVYNDICWPSLLNNTTNRQILYSVYDIIVLCCIIEPHSLTSLIINRCLQSILDFTKDTACSSVGLPVLVSMDFLTYFFKSEARDEIDNDTYEKLFESVLDALSISDEHTSARIASGILLQFLQPESGKNIDAKKFESLWSRLKKISENQSFSDKSTDKLQNYYTVMCSLIDIVMVTNPESSVLRDPKFWELIQQGLKLQDPLLSKQAMYLFQKSLDLIEKRKMSLEVKDENGAILFCWEPENKKMLMEFWQEFVLLIETLSETQVHVIKPVLSKFAKIISACSQKNDNSKILHFSWMTTIIHKASLHPNKSLRKWAALEIMTMDLSKSPLLLPQNWAFLLGHFQTMLGEYSLYSKDHDGISGTQSPVGTALHGFYKNCFECLPKELHVEFITKLIEAIEKFEFSAAPLACIFNSLASVPSSLLLGKESLKRIRNILLNLRTHAITFRLATKAFILTTVVNLTDLTIVNWDDIFGFLSVGRIEECLQRHSWIWSKLCSWIKAAANSPKINAEMSSIGDDHCAILRRFVNEKVLNFLKQDIHQELVDKEVASLGLFIVAVADSLYKQDDLTITCFIKDLFSLIFKTFDDASTRLYMQESTLSNTAALVTSLLKVTDSSHGNIEENKCDFIKGLISNTLKNSLTDILNLLQRKFTSRDTENVCTNWFVYLKLAQAIHYHLVSNRSMTPCIKQFTLFITSITSPCLNRTQYFHGYSNHGFSNHGDKEWSQMHQLMAIIAWICDISLDKVVPVEESVTKLILDAVSRFKLNIQFKKPKPLINDKNSLDAIATLRSSVPGYLGALWKTVIFYLRKEHVPIPLKQPNDDITVASSNKEMLDVAMETLNITSSDNAIPIMTSIGLLMPQLVDCEIQLCIRALDQVWCTLKELWDHPSFWEILNTTATVILSPSLLMLPEEHLLTIKLKSLLRELFAEGELRHGIMNVVVKHLSKVWTTELASCCCKSLLTFKEMVVEFLLFNASVQKTHIIDANIEAFLRHDASPQSPLCVLSGIERRDDAQVRIIMINTLLALSTSSKLHQVQTEVIRCLLARDDKISIANPTMYANSRNHRKKHHAWQAVIVLLQLVMEHDHEGRFSKEVLSYAFSSLEYANQLSVQNYQQWTILSVLDRFPNMATFLWEQLQLNSEKRVGRISLLATVTMLFVIHCVKDSAQRPLFFQRAISSLFPWISVNHRQARVHAQFAVQRMWDSCAEENLGLVLNERNLIEPCLKFMMTNKDTLADKVKLFENYFFFDFNPVQDVSMETIYLTLPKLAGVAEEEWIHPNEFQENALGMDVWGSHAHCGIPLHNKNRRLADYKSELFDYTETVDVQLKRRIRGDKLSQTQRPNITENTITSIGDVQKKIVAWKIVPPDEMMMAELQQQRMLSLQKSSGGNLIVVASLIDKAPNLGGLCRTSEIFGVKKLVIGSNEVMKDKNFKNLSVSSSKWIDVEQVRPVDLKDYLQQMQQQGYILIGVEQTANSKHLTEYTFPHNALLLLGNEKEGIPADLIQLLDVCVEIPQVGVIRSLNVHVSGALLIWEYTRQNVLSLGNTADK